MHENQNPPGAATVDPSAERNPPRAVTIGWAERVDIPAWGVRRLRAKVDTGARTSALHVSNITELKGGLVRFDVILDRRHPERSVTIETPIVRKACVRPSSGHSESRIFVEVVVRIGPIDRAIELSLVGRERMMFRMLLGRSALGARFVVDASRRYVLSGAGKGRRPRGARRMAPHPMTPNRPPTAGNAKHRRSADV